MLIRFLRDFRSAATGEQFYQAGEVADLERGAEVVAEGAAEPAEAGEAADLERGAEVVAEGAAEPAEAGEAGDEPAPARTKRGRK